jgi:hypothetical protein
MGGWLLVKYLNKERKNKKEKKEKNLKRKVILFVSDNIQLCKQIYLMIITT